jgi:transcriptional regulator with XRE-family HTH domain
MRMKRPDIRYKFGKKLRQLRKQRGWTQEELAEHADIAYKHVQRLEGKTPSPVKIDTIEKLAKAFKISSSRLLDF